MTPAMVQYTGDLKSLLPSGWRFQKLYAKNYRAYMKDDMIIWQSGREFNVSKYDHFTSVLVSHILAHGVESLRYYDWLFGHGNYRYWLTLDMVNLELIKFDTPEYRAYRRSLYACSTDEDLDAYYARFREANVGLSTMTEIERLINSGQLKLVKGVK